MRTFPGGEAETGRAIKRALDDLEAHPAFADRLANFARDRERRENRIHVSVILACVAGCAGLCWLWFMAAAYDEREWVKFRDAHHCRVTGDVAASNGYGFSSKGSLVATYEPGKTIWTCDDGMTHVR